MKISSDATTRYGNKYDNDAWFSEKYGIGYSDGAFSSYDNLKQSYPSAAARLHRVAGKLASKQ